MLSNHLKRRFGAVCPSKSGWVINSKKHWSRRPPTFFLQPNIPWAPDGLVAQIFSMLLWSAFCFTVSKMGEHMESIATTSKTKLVFTFWSSAASGQPWLQSPNPVSPSLSQSEKSKTSDEGERKAGGQEGGSTKGRWARKADSRGFAIPARVAWILPLDKIYIAAGFKDNFLLCKIVEFFSRFFCTCQIQIHVLYKSISISQKNSNESNSYI